MDSFFNPDGVAIVGATPNPRKGGYHILNNTINGYKTGKIYPINPKYDSMLGLPCYPDIDSIPDDFELAIYFISARFLPDTIRECSRKNVKGIIIESAGFAEVGEDGRRLQNECLKLAREYNIRLWGPNCMGLLDGYRRHVFSFIRSTAWKSLMVPGNVSMIVQSGMLSSGLLMMVLERGGIGINKICSIGNKCDVHETDLLEYLINDDLTDVIGLYVESFADARRFMQLARSTHKPIVVLKGGRSPEGAQAAISHTASIAGNHAIINSAFKQAGIIQVFDINELMDFLRGFSKIKDSRNDGGTAIITFSGGGGIVTADFLNDYGLPLAHFSDETLKSIKSIFPQWMDPTNPLDLWPAIELNGVEKVYETAIDALAKDDNVDSIILHLFANWIPSSSLKTACALKDQQKKPVIAWLVGMGSAFHTFRNEVEDMGIPIFDEIGRCAGFLSAVKKHFYNIR
ncbi:MAG: CoA-binding protein [Deltaproteobacteria bacterium]|nr:CoA-binding protein [Deltaproteobacteria bacterium]